MVLAAKAIAKCWLLFSRWCSQRQTESTSDRPHAHTQPFCTPSNKTPSTARLVDNTNNLYCNQIIKIYFILFLFSSQRARALYFGAWAVSNTKHTQWHENYVERAIFDKQRKLGKREKERKGRWWGTMVSNKNKKERAGTGVRTWKRDTFHFTRSVLSRVCLHALRPDRQGEEVGKRRESTHARKYPPSPKMVVRCTNNNNKKCFVALRIWWKNCWLN